MGREVWRGTEKQDEFLSCPDYEVLFGGAAGGGKSDALMMDLWALEANGPMHPKHRAILFRRSYPELKDIIDRSKELFPQFIRGVKYDKNEHVWTTPAGAKYEFGYLNNDADRFKYKRAWNKIGFDELTLWPTPRCYEYLITRNRTVARDLPCEIRSTTNPDGPGQLWVMKRFGIQEDGRASRQLLEMDFEVEVGPEQYAMEQRIVARSFIPSLLSDNPFLRGTGYRERLLLGNPEDADALLRGLWKGNKVEGAFYFREMQKARGENRLCRVPFVPGVPVNSFWDLGINDANSIWLHQQVGLENHFIHTYQNSGERLDHYSSYLQKLGSDRGFTWGTHYLPHDGAHRSRQTGKRDIDILMESWHGQRWEIVPQVDHRLTGINLTRQAFPSCYFDIDECADGLAAIDNYRKRWNKTIEAFSDEPVHDLNSNYADALRQFGQGFDGARVHIHAAEPEWRKKLRAHHARGRRNPMTA